MKYYHLTYELKTRLQKLQNKAGRVIAGDSYYSSVSNTLMKLGWNTLQCRDDEQLLSLVNKCISGNPQLNHLFNGLNRYCYDLRSNNIKLHLPKANTNAMKRTLRYRSAMICNSFSQNS